MTADPGVVAELQEAIRGGGPRVLPVAGATKPALSVPADGDVRSLDVSGLSGIVAYDPGELTLTALASTPVAEVHAALAASGQYLPFDPPLRDAGATLGGVVASATSGPGAFRYGGVRDFVIGARFLDGTGRLITAGGRVVKNAAGFDLPKLLVGSMGRLGVIVELSFKVFPQAEASTTLVFAPMSLRTALPRLVALGRGRVALAALEIDEDGRLLAAIAGDADTLAGRADRLAALAGEAPERLLTGDEDEALWTRARELTWVAAGERVLRVALTSRELPALHDAVRAAGGRARVGLGGNLLWVAWPREAPTDPLEAALQEHGLRAVALTGPPGHLLLGTPGAGAFAARVTSAIDPTSRFLEIA